MPWRAAALLFLAAVVLILLLLLLGCAAPGVQGGAPGVVVVDTLNLVHAAVGRTLQDGDVRRVVVDHADAMRARGLVPVYVIKARAAGEDLVPYQRLAREARVRIMVAVPFQPGQAPPRPCGTTVPAERVAHSKRASDDFLVALVCKKYNARALTADRMSDFGTFRANLEPFRAHEFVWWDDPPTVESIIPCSPAYADLRRPARIRLSS